MIFPNKNFTMGLANKEDVSQLYVGPTVCDFQVRNTTSFRNYIKDKPHIHVNAVEPGEYAIGYTDEKYIYDIAEEFVDMYINHAPSIFGLLGMEELKAAGIMPLQNNPSLKLKGSGVLLGFVDTGIDYTKEAFKYEDNTSKIQYIWDQTIQGNPPEQLHYGTEYTNKQINEALKAENPFDIVPHKDTVGHGTFLASVAGGREDKQYIGAAPDAEIIVVKLLKARPVYLEDSLVPKEQENAFESTDIMLGITYIIRKAAKLKRPVAICLGVGTNFGNHDGLSIFGEYLNSVARLPGVALCLAAGNESQARHHTQGIVPQTGETEKIDVNAGVSHGNIAIYLWNNFDDRFSVSIISPTGETSRRVIPKSGSSSLFNLIFEKASIIVNYYTPVTESGSQLTIIKILNATPGIWSIIIHGDIVLDGTYHAWLPLTGFIADDVAFLNPVSNTTIVSDAGTLGTITCGAYDSYTNSLFVNSSWGPTNLPRVSPELVAPGVNVTGVYPSGYGSMSGTSVAAAITTGACALMLQWGIVDKNNISLNNYSLRAFLVRGCKREENLSYPNNQWGYGKLDLIQTFNLLRYE